MFIKIAALAAGVSGAVVLSQVPEFTQQYQQRLAGQVDALTTVVLDFDASALNAGLGREQALAELTGTPFLVSRQGDMRRTFDRHARLSANLIALQSATPLQRLLMPQRLTDPATLSATWVDFAPALPLTLAGVVTTAGGGVVGWLAGLSLLSLLVLPFRRITRASPPAKPQTTMRKEPAVVRPKLTAVADDPRPRLMGATR